MNPPPSDKPLGELELIAACVAGHESAWDLFHERFHPIVLQAAERALRRLGERDPASRAPDVAADVFAHLLERDRHALRRFEGRSSVATWLKVLTRRRAGRVLRRLPPASLEAPQAVPAEDLSPSDVAVVSERERIVQEHLARLAPRDRLALQLFYEGGKSYREVAEALNLPPERVGTVLARARRRLARALTGEQ